MKKQPLHVTSHFIELCAGENTRRMPIVIRRHRSSRRMTLRYQPLQQHLLLTLPRYVSIKQGLHFIEEKRKWIEKQIDETVQHFPFVDGQLLPLLGKEVCLRHVGGRGVITLSGSDMLVPGEAEFMSRRVQDWLRRCAREHLNGLARSKAQIIGKQVRQVTVRDTISRWGSCSYDGNLSFSWRLVLAPYPVLDYVVSHEVAHLKEFNHSDTFWSVVEQLSPGHVQWRDWLGSNGHILYGYGSSSSD
jgi:predicted metal-dependent hydrolase